MGRFYAAQVQGHEAFTILFGDLPGKVHTVGTIGGPLLAEEVVMFLNELELPPGSVESINEGNGPL